MRAAWLLPLALALAPVAAHAETELRGKVDGRMSQAVAAALKSGERSFVINSSNGGEVLHAVLIAALLESYQASVTANGTCLSACSMILFGVTRRFVTGEARVGVHAWQAPSNNPVAVTAGVEWMLSHGFPADLSYRMEGPNIYTLSAQDLARGGVQAK